MRYKKILLLTIIITCLFAISAVSATENDANDIVGVDTTDEVVMMEEYQVIEQAENKEVICGTDNGTFTALQEKIRNTEQNSIITLENDYSYDEGFDTEGIIIDKPLTIDGKNRVIDANSKSRIFLMTSNNIILKNIVFKGGTHYLVGGAISNSGNYCNLSSCSFINCSIESYSARGGAIYNTGEYCNIVSCNFTNCSVYAGDFEDDEGGAIRDSKGNSIVRLCNFIECKSRFFGGALSGGSTVNCTFIRCNSKVGGAIYYVSAENCTFINNTAEEYGGAGFECTPILNCKFIGNKAKYSGALWEGSIVNSIFINNLAQSAGVSSFSNSYGCTFINNSAEYGGVLGSSAYAYNCRFIGNFAQYGGIAHESFIFDSYIKDCYSYVEGGAIYRGYGLSNNTFENCYSYGYGGACSDTYINNCTFISCHSMMGGGATYNCGKVTNSNFINCYCERDGGAIYSKKSSIEDCNFTGCFARFDGGAIYTIDFLIINKNNFMGCQASDGGAICLWYNGGNITECSFDNCRANHSGGAIYSLEYTNVDNGIFNGCSANEGGAIFFNGHDSKLVNSIFKGNSANKNPAWYTAYPLQEYNNIIDNKIPTNPTNPTNTIKPVAKTTITLKTVKIKKSAKKLVLQATLKQGNTPLKSKQVTFKFNGKKYTAKTNAKGVAKVTINKNILKKLKVGNNVKYQASYGKIISKKTSKVKK